MNIAEKILNQPASQSVELFEMLGKMTLQRLLFAKAEMTSERCASEFKELLERMLRD